MEILNQTIEKIEAGTYINFHHPIFIIFGIICVIGLIYFITAGIQEHHLFLGIIGAALLIILGIGISITIATTPIYEEVTRYEVTINSDTNFYDIIDNYDIIEQRGKIFILQDKR